MIDSVSATHGAGHEPFGHACTVDHDGLDHKGVQVGSAARLVFGIGCSRSHSLGGDAGGGLGRGELPGAGAAVGLLDQGLQQGPGRDVGGGLGATRLRRLTCMTKIYLVSVGPRVP